ncbi:MAG: DUF374 domain-containing protein [Alphaproteobacteria bacterium]|nr:DUF374 domain-containing protein [Alphaproteobacteria bacterium]
MSKQIKKLIKNILKTPIAMKLIGALAYYYSLFVFKTSRWEGDGLEQIKKIITTEKNMIVIAWHGRVLLSPNTVFSLPKKVLKNVKVKALVSPHQDGVIMANYIKHFGVGIVEGSTNRNASNAAIQLMNAIKKEDETIFIVPDGPVGPSMELKKSPLYFAQKANKPIYFVTYSQFRVPLMKKAWDNMMIPRPFKRGAFKVLGPFYVPQEAGEEEIEKIRLEIETKANQIFLALDKEMEVEPVEIGKMAKKKKRG